MMQEPQQSPQTKRHDPELDEPCTVCGADAIQDPASEGLNCAHCGQWQFLCGECMPEVPDNSRDASWLCPECRDPTYH